MPSFTKRSSNLKRRFSRDIYKSVKFVFSKLANWTSAAAGRNSQWQIFALDRCVLRGIWGLRGGHAEATEGYADCIGKPTRRQLRGVVLGPTRRLCHTSAHFRLRGGCALKETLLKMDTQSFVGSSSFWSFVFPKAPMLSWRCEALCNSVQGWWRCKGEQVDVKKKLEVSWSSHFLVEGAMRPISLKWIWNSKWNLQTWKHQAQTLELCHLASDSEMGICVAPSIEISLDSNTQWEIEGYIFNPDAVWNEP